MIKLSRGCCGEEELRQVKEAFDYGYTDEGLKLAGFNDVDIKRVKG